MRDRSETQGVNEPKRPDKVTLLEQGVLGAILIDPSKTIDILGETEDLFTVLVHREIFKTLCQMWQDGDEIDVFTVSERCKVPVSLTCSMANDAVSLNFWGDLELLRQYRTKRRLARIANEMLHDLESKVPHEVASEASLKLHEMLSPQNGALRRFDDIALTMIAEAESGQVPETLSTGLTLLDAALGDGLRRKTLTVIAARPSMGKSALSTQIAVHNAKEGKTVLVFSLEMPSQALVTRIVSTEIGVEPVKLRRAKMQTDWVQVRSRLQRLTSQEFWFHDDSAITSSQIISTAREMKVKQGLDLVVVDYLQRVNDVMRSRENRNQLLGQVTRNLAILARECNCAVILVSQLNRNAAGRRPTMADLRDSGETEQDADNILLIHREAYYSKDPNDHSAEIIIEKQREGPTTSVTLYWDAERVQFRVPEVRYG